MGGFIAIVVMILIVVVGVTVIVKAGDNVDGGEPCLIYVMIAMIIVVVLGALVVGGLLLQLFGVTH